MHDLQLEITGVQPRQRGLVPLFEFQLNARVTPADIQVQALIVHAQIQILAPHRRYSPAEQERLTDLFGEPERWGETLRSRFWTRVHANTGPFTGSIQVPLVVPVTFDLNVAAAKYFYALEDGDVPLLFLFSGSVFYGRAGGSIRVAPIPWNKESEFRLPIARWRELMDEHYPNSAWVELERDRFDRLYTYKRRHGLATWEEVIDRLLPAERHVPA